MCNVIIISILTVNISLHTSALRRGSQYSKMGYHLTRIGDADMSNQCINWPHCSSYNFHEISNRQLCLSCRLCMILRTKSEKRDEFITENNLVMVYLTACLCHNLLGGVLFLK